MAMVVSQTSALPVSIEPSVESASKNACAPKEGAPPFANAFGLALQRETASPESPAPSDTALGEAGEESAKTRSAEKSAEAPEDAMLWALYAVVHPALLSPNPQASPPPEIAPVLNAELENGTPPTEALAPMAPSAEPPAPLSPNAEETPAPEIVLERAALVVAANPNPAPAPLATPNTVEAPQKPSPAVVSAAPNAKQTKPESSPPLSPLAALLAQKTPQEVSATQTTPQNALLFGDKPPVIPVLGEGAKPTEKPLVNTPLGAPLVFLAPEAQGDAASQGDSETDREGDLTETPQEPTLLEPSHAKPSEFHALLHPKSEGVTRPETPAVATPVTQNLTPAERIEALEQATRHIENMRLERGMGDMTLTLRPDHLGEIHIRIQTGGEGVTAHILTQNSGVQQVLEGAKDHLKQALEQRGMTLADFQVGLASGAFSGDSAPQPRPQDTPRTRTLSRTSGGRGVRFSLEGASRSAEVISPRPVWKDQESRLDSLA